MISSGSPKIIHFRRGAYDPDVEEALKNNRPREQAEFNLERELLAASKNLNSDVIKNIANEITDSCEDAFGY